MQKFLSTVIREHFFVSNAIIKLMSEFIIALIQLRDVNLSGIALAICGESEISAGYRKLQRFFAKVEICSVCLARLIVKLAGLKDKKWKLIMDRTSWKFGKLNINILVLGIERCGVAIPILWSMLDNKGGNSNVLQRKELMSKFISIFGVDCIESLLADREFIGDEWLKFLADNEVKFYIRIRSDITINRADKELVTANNTIKKLKNGEYIALPGQRYLGQNYKGPKLMVAACRNQDGNLVIVATNDNVDQAMENYRQRWSIETLFACLKTRGFNFENTHMIDLVRIEKLLALLALAFTLCHIVGIWQNELKPIKLKRHGRKMQSLFRYGLDYLRQMFLSTHLFTKSLLNLFHFLCPTKTSLTQILTIC